MIWVIILSLVVVLFGFVVAFGAPYVPSHTREIRQAFVHLYPLSANDVVVDLGCGDGRVLREARRHDARAVGCELNPLLVFICRWMSRHDRGVTVRAVNYWRTSLPSDTTLVYMFGVSRDSRRLAKKLQEESKRLRHPLFLMTYGPNLPDHMAVKKYRGYHLYRFEPSLSRVAHAIL